MARPCRATHVPGDSVEGRSSSSETESLAGKSMARMQREVQRKLQEQIEVQRHLQLRIEAQEKYLQFVLRRAQEVLAGHGSPELSAVETGSLSSSSSLSPSPPRDSSAAGSCVTSPSSEAESHAAAGSKGSCTCAAEQPVQGKRTFLQSHEAEEADTEEEGDDSPARKTPTEGKETATRNGVVPWAEMGHRIDCFVACEDVAGWELAIVRSMWNGVDVVTAESHHAG